MAEFGGRCPANLRLRRPCGRYHPAVTGGVTRPVEQVAEMLAGGDLVPLRDWHGNVIIVRAAGFRRWQEMTDGGGAWNPAIAAVARARQLGPPQIGVCTADHHAPARIAVLTHGQADADRRAQAAPEPFRAYAGPVVRHDPRPRRQLFGHGLPCRPGLAHRRHQHDRRIVPADHLNGYPVSARLHQLHRTSVSADRPQRQTALAAISPPAAHTPPDTRAVAARTPRGCCAREVISLRWVP